MFGAIVESYLPLIDVIEGWRRDGVDYRLTLSLSPTLAAMLDDPLLRWRFRRHLNAMIELARLELTRTRLLHDLYPVAQFNYERLLRCRTVYTDLCGGDIVGTLGRMAGDGRLELIVSSATHAFLPVLQHQPWAVRAQIRVAVEEFERRFGRKPAGLWTGECGYYPGLDEMLREAGARYFFVDTHGLMWGDAEPKRGSYAPVTCPSGVAAFGRDLQTSREVWSAREGYPGDPLYREYYRDAGFDLELDYLRPYIHESGLRVATGIKYHRVTGDVALHEKQSYDPRAARGRAIEHAREFVARRRRQIGEVVGALDRPPLIVSPYDAELFGHWWFEGPVFIDHVMRAFCSAPGAIDPITPGQYLERYPEQQTLTPSFSSWGSGGYAQVWLDESNKWIYPHLHQAGDRMRELAQQYRATDLKLRRRALAQMARELLLAQSSDWPFIMKTGSAADYAARRVRDHLGWFHALERQVHDGPIDEDALGDREANYPIFPRLRFEAFAP